MKYMVVDRVGVMLEKFDIPREFPTGFYCRREKTENATINVRKIKEETLFSDIFHLRIFEVNRDCPVHINLPLYKPPSEKEQMILRFYNCPLEDRTIDECIMNNQVRCIVHMRLNYMFQQCIRFFKYLDNVRSI